PPAQPTWVEVIRGLLHEMRTPKADDSLRLGARTTARRSARQRRPILMLAVSSILLIAAIIGCTVLIAQSFRERAAERATHDLESSAVLIARYIEQEFEELSRIQNSIIELIIINGSRDSNGSYDIASSAGSDNNHLLLESAARTLPFVTRISFVTSDGRLINSSGF